jgi:uncharacterized protein (TIGR03437 family)
MRPGRFVLGFLLWSAIAAGQQYVISTIAGGAPTPTPTPGLSLSVGTCYGIAAGLSGDVYFANSDQNSVFRLEPTGTVTRVAGNSRVGYSGDGGPASNAQLTDPNGLAVDRAGNLFIADSGNRRIRKVSKDGIITTVAGNGACCFSGDGGPAVSAAMDYPFGLAADGEGNLFVADLRGHRVRKISSAGIITTVAGTGSDGFSGDGGPAINARLAAPAATVLDGAGNLYIADYNNSRIRKISVNGIITTELTVRSLSLGRDGEGNLFIADWNGGCVRKRTASGSMTILAGDSQHCPGSRDNVPATGMALLPAALAVDAAGNIFIKDALGSRLRKVTPDGNIAAVAGTGNWCCFSGDGGPATAAQLNDPAGIALDGDGNFFIADAHNSKIRKVSPDGNIATVAEGCGFPDDYDSPCGIAADSRGNFYVSDEYGVRKISPDGATARVFDRPTYGIATDRAGNLYYSNGFSSQIRRVSPSGETTPVAGTGSTGYSGDGGPATAAELSYPGAMATDPAGNLYFVDHGETVRIRKVTSDGTITTVAGGGADDLLDGRLATSGKLRDVIGLAADGAGNLYFQEFSVFYPTYLEIPKGVRKVSPDGVVTTIAGAGGFGYSGDGGPAIHAHLNPRADARGNNLAIDSSDNLYVADAGNNAIRLLHPIKESVWVGSVVDAASLQPAVVSPGKIVVLYGMGLGPAQLTQNPPNNGRFGTDVSGTQVSFNEIAAPVFYTSATQVAAVVPYTVTATAAQVTVTYEGRKSAAFTVPVAPSSPSLFTLNQSGAGQALAINAIDGTVNTAANPAKIGEYISFYATGESQTVPAGVDGKLGGPDLARPVLPVSVTVDGLPAIIQYAGSVPGQVAGLMQVNVRIPDGIQPGGYVPVVLNVGDRSSSPGVWVAISAN